jgi:hypothetical protein
MPKLPTIEKIVEKRSKLDTRTEKYVYDNVEYGTEKDSLDSFDRIFKDRRPFEVKVIERAKKEVKEFFNPSNSQLTLFEA